MAVPIDLARAETAHFTPSPAHELLGQFTGAWRGPSTLWMEPGTPPEHTTTELQAELVLGGRWLRLTYHGVAGAKPHAGEMLIGFHNDANQYELAWIDSFHTASSIMLSTGAPAEPGVVEVLGGFGSAEQRWGWRTRLHKASPHELVLEAFIITPTGEEARALEVKLARVG
jgi:hypothetical protein